MCLFVETLRIQDGKVWNIEYHNRRMNDTRATLFGAFSVEEDIRYYFSDLSIYKERTKCRILYREKVEKIEYLPYQLPCIESLRLVVNDDVDYRYKCIDRKSIDRLFALRGETDDILIVKNGLLTDTSFCNVALYDGSNWVTPRNPLLKGTQRAFLLDRNRLREADISVMRIRDYKCISLFNAMISFGEIEIPVSRIFY